MENDYAMLDCGKNIFAIDVFEIYVFGILHYYYLLNVIQIVIYIYLNFFVFCLLRAAPVAHGGSQARGRIGVVAAGPRHSHSHARS